MEVTATQLLSLLREGTAPAKVRTAIARNTLPLPPPVLLEALDILADDPEVETQADALRSLGQLPPVVVRAVASSPSSPPELLDRLASRYPDREDILCDIARNPATADGTAVRLAALALPAVLEVVGRNQTRLERAPEIVAALLANPATPLALVQLWQEQEARRPAASRAAVAVAVEAAAEDLHEFAPILVEEEEGPAGPPSAKIAVEADGALSAKQLSIYAMLKQMSMGQKVALAMKGNREVRNLLIRENNKMLCLKVLDNPRVGDSDVEAWAKSTNVPEDVLRGISNRKEWVAKYSILKALVTNPKAPIGVTLTFMPRLTLKDLEFLAKNRNVPETLRSSARRLAMAKRSRNE